MSLFVNNTVRSVDAALADLAACRQFRHLTGTERAAIIDGTTAHVSESRAAWSLKHPNPDNQCIKCGEPRSVYSMGRLGLCRNCYMTNLVDLWIEDVFTVAVKLCGFSCDACGRVFEVHEIERRFAAKRCLENLDGIVKPILCPGCSQDYKSFCSRHCGRAWRSMPARDIEKMSLAWLAQKVKVLAQKVRAA